MQRTPWFRVIPGWIGWYFLIFFWEVLTIPGVSHSNSWHGVVVSLLVLPFGANRLSRVGARAGTMFVYGCAGALLFVPRFLMMDRFALWLHYQAPSTSVIVLCWVAFALFMGALCFYAALSVSDQTEESESSSSDQPT